MTGICLVSELLRLREVQSLAQGHRAGKRRSRDSYRGLPGSGGGSFPNTELLWLGSNHNGAPVLRAGTPTWRWILVRSDLGVNKPTNELQKVLLMEIPMWLIQLLLGELQPPTVFVSDCQHQCK